MTFVQFKLITPCRIIRPVYKTTSNCCITNRICLWSITFRRFLDVLALWSTSVISDIMLLPLHWRKDDDNSPYGVCCSVSVRPCIVTETGTSMTWTSSDATCGRASRPSPTATTVSAAANIRPRIRSRSSDKAQNISDRCTTSSRSDAPTISISSRERLLT